MLDQLPSECWSIIFEFMEFFEILAISHKLSRSISQQLFHSPSSHYIFLLLCNQLLKVQLLNYLKSNTKVLVSDSTFRKKLSRYSSQYYSLFHEELLNNEKLADQSFKLIRDRYVLLILRRTFTIHNYDEEYLERFFPNEMKEVVLKATKFMESIKYSKEMKGSIEWKQVYLQNLIAHVERMTKSFDEKQDSVYEYLLQCEHLFELLEKGQRGMISRILMFFNPIVSNICKVSTLTNGERKVLESLIEFYINAVIEGGKEGLSCKSLKSNEQPEFYWSQPLLTVANSVSNEFLLNCIQIFREYIKECNVKHRSQLFSRCFKLGQPILNELCSSEIVDLEVINHLKNNNENNTENSKLFTIRELDGDKIISDMLERECYAKFVGRKLNVIVKEGSNRWIGFCFEIKGSLSGFVF